MRFPFPQRIFPSVAAGTIICVAVTFTRRRLGIFFALCDGAFFAGTVLLCAGIFSLLAKNGAFSALSFGLKTFAARFRREPKDGHFEIRKTYFDYASKKNGAATSAASYFAAGGFFLALAFLFLAFC